MRSPSSTRSLAIRRSLWEALKRPGDVYQLALRSGVHVETLRQLLKRWEHEGLLRTAMRSVPGQAGARQRKVYARLQIKQWATTVVDDGRRTLRPEEQEQLWRASRVGRSSVTDIAFACAVPVMLASPWLHHLARAGYYEQHAAGRFTMGAWSGPQPPLVFTHGVTFDQNLCDVIWSPVDEAVRLSDRRAA
jgi:transposase